MHPNLRLKVFSSKNRPHRSRILLLAACILLLPPTYPCRADSRDQPAPQSQANQSVPPLDWINAAEACELNIVNDDGAFAVRYRVHKVDARGETTRVIITTPQGSVARLVELNGQPLTREENDAERDRLQAILNDPSTFFKHRRRDAEDRDYSLSLIKLMPQAMLYSYAPGQPQPPGATSPQLVIDFHPNPRFSPPTLISEALTGLEGRFWIDRRTHCVTRAEGRIIKPVNFGWGILARIYAGGTIEFEQQQIAPNHWIYSHVDENITVREMMLKTAVERVTMSASNVEVLPRTLDYRSAIQALLAMPVPAR